MVDIEHVEGNKFFDGAPARSGLAGADPQDAETGRAGYAAGTKFTVMIFPQCSNGREVLGSKYCLTHKKIHCLPNKKNGSFCIVLDTRTTK